MIKDAGIKHCDYSMLPNFWQILLHWGYQLTEKYVFFSLTQQIYV